MIRDYANHAANERTFLAWVRTGIAIIAAPGAVPRIGAEHQWNAEPGRLRDFLQAVVKLRRDLGRLAGIGAHQNPADMPIDNQLGRIGAAHRLHVVRVIASLKGPVGGVRRRAAATST